MNLVLFKLNEEDGTNNRHDKEEIHLRNLRKQDRVKENDASQSPLALQAVSHHTVRLRHNREAERAAVATMVVAVDESERSDNFNEQYTIINEQKFINKDVRHLLINVQKNKSF